MVKHYYNDNWYSTNELAELSGLLPHTLRDRLRRGYTIEQAVKSILTHNSVEQFAESSWWKDWIGLPMSELHTTYWKWCLSHGYQPLSNQAFSKQLIGLYPQLKTVPNKVNGKSVRIIRLRA